MLQFFDIEGFLQENNIDYSEGGEKNVAQGWIGVSCFQCGDSSNHLGINLSSKLLSCWKCGYRSSVISLILYHLQCTYTEALAIVGEYQNYQTHEVPKETKKTFGQEILPKIATKNISEQYISFLKKRRFSTEIIKRYDLYGGSTIGEYRYRFIIPIIIQKEIVSFTSMDITGKQKIKYKHASIENSIIPAKDCIYGLDLVSDRMLLVEGITDAWRMGPGAVATMGMEVSKTQLHFIAQAAPKEIFIMFDGEKQANINAHKLAQTLSMLGKSVEVIQLSHGDPDNLSNTMVKHLRAEIGL